MYGMKAFAVSYITILFICAFVTAGAAAFSDSFWLSFRLSLVVLFIVYLMHLPIVSPKSMQFELQDFGWKSLFCVPTKTIVVISAFYLVWIVSNRLGFPNRFSILFGAICISLTSQAIRFGECILRKMSYITIMKRAFEFGLCVLLVAYCFFESAYQLRLKGAEAAVFPGIFILAIHWVSFIRKMLFSMVHFKKLPAMGKAKGVQNAIIIALFCSLILVTLLKSMIWFEIIAFCSLLFAFTSHFSRKFIYEKLKQAH